MFLAKCRRIFTDCLRSSAVGFLTAVLNPKASYKWVFYMKHLRNLSNPGGCKGNICSSHAALEWHIVASMLLSISC